MTKALHLAAAANFFGVMASYVQGGWNQRQATGRLRSFPSHKFDAIASMKRKNPRYFWAVASNPLEAALRNVKGRQRRAMIRDTS